MLAHTDGRGCRMLPAACQRGPMVSEAGQANIPLEEGDSMSNTLTQYQLSSLVLWLFFTSYEHLHPFIKDRSSNSLPKYYHKIMKNNAFYTYESISPLSFSLNTCGWVGLWVEGSKQPLPLCFGLFEVKTQLDAVHAKYATYHTQTHTHKHS